MLTHLKSFAAFCALATCATSIAQAQSATAWVEGHNSKARMIAGTLAKPVGPSRTIAGIEITMADGWKTYWRNPGDAGGVPPFFDWAGSENLASAKVLFPAPSRLKDASGNSVGYKKVRGVSGRSDGEGPVEARHVQTRNGVRRLPRDLRAGRGQALAGDAGCRRAVAGSARHRLELVPRKATDRRPADPELKATRAMLTGDKPSSRSMSHSQATAPGADVFIEAPDGVYLSLPKKIQSATAGVQTFEVDLATGVDIAEIKGKTLVVTMVSATGQSEATWKID